MLAVRSRSIPVPSWGCPSCGRGLPAPTPPSPLPPRTPRRAGAAELEGSSRLSPNDHGLRDLRALNLPFGGRLECVSPPNSPQKQRTSLISFRALLSPLPRLIPLNVKPLQTFPGDPQPPGICLPSWRTRRRHPVGQHPPCGGSGGALGKAATSYGQKSHRSCDLLLNLGAVVRREAESGLREQCLLLLRGFC